MPQDGHGTSTSRSSHEVLATVIDDTRDQGTAAEFDRSSSGRSTSTASRPGKPGELPYSAIVQQDLLNPAAGECRRLDAAVLERSIYDHMPEHFYTNVEKDESGRLLNRDTLAFRTSDYETVTSAMSSNGQVGTPCLIDTSASRVDHSRDVPVVIHRTNRTAAIAATNSSNHNSLTDRTQSDTAAEQVPYHTGRSVFYQRVDSSEGNQYFMISHAA